MKNEQKTITNANEVRQSKPNVPTLRFKRYTTEWTKISLSNYLFVSSKRNKDGRFSKEDVLSVSGELGIVNQIALLGRSYAGESVLPYHIVEKGDIVYTKSPLALYPYGIIKTNRNKVGIVSTLYAVYKTKDNANNRFIEHYFSLKSRINNYLKPIVRIGAKHDMKIGNNEVLDNIVTFPDISEQCEIADFLDLLDNRISVQNKIISKYEALIKGLCDKIFRHDKSVCLSDLVKCKTSTLQENEIATYYDGKYKVFGASGIIATIDKYQFEKDSILVLKDGSKAGKIQYAGGKYSVVGTSVVLIPNNADDARYLYFAMRSIDFDKYKVGSGIPHIYFKDYSYERIYYPNSALRAKIVKVLDAYETKVEIEKEMLSALQKQKAFLLQSMFI